MNKKSIAITAGIALLVSVSVQQIAYRNSAEYKMNRIVTGLREDAQREQEERCESYEQLKKDNPSWTPFDNYYDDCF